MTELSEDMETIDTQDDVDVSQDETHYEESDDISVEEKASHLGWVPEDRFRGPKEKWVDAETFLKNSEERPGYAINDNKKLHQKLAEMERKMKQQADKFQEDLKRATDREVKRIEREYKQKMDQAIVEGDLKRVRELEREADEEKRSLQSEASEQTSYEAMHAIERFRAENDWYETNRPMTLYAQDQSSEIADKMPGLSYEEHLEEVKRRVEKEFPHHFSSTNTQRAQVMNVASGRRVMPKQKAKTYESLPAEFKEACDYAHRNYGVSKEDYVRYYYEELEKSNVNREM